MPLAGKRLGVGAARLLGEQHREALVALLLRIGAHQQRHQIRAHGMGDPGLVPRDLVDVALSRGPRAQRGEVRAGVGLGEHRRRQDFARWRSSADISPSARACRRRGSIRRRSPSACRASRPRYSRAKAPRRRRTSRLCRAPGRRALQGSSARTRPCRRGPGSLRAGYSCSSGANPAHAGSLRLRRSGASRRASRSASRRGRGRRSRPPAPVR